MKKRLAMLLVCLLLAGCIPAMAAGCAEPDAQRMDVKYVCTGFTAVGMSEMGPALQGEQYMIFSADGTCRLAIGGPAMQLPYSVRCDGVYEVAGGGVRFECVPTASGFDMDLYGLTLHYAPQTSRSASADDGARRLEVRYVCTGFTVVGQPGDLADLPGEQYLCFGADGMCDFAIGGPAVRVPYRVRGDGVYVVNWYGVEFECVPTAGGFEMDFYGVLISYAPDR